MSNRIKNLLAILSLLLLVGLCVQGGNAPMAMAGDNATDNPFAAGAGREGGQAADDPFGAAPKQDAKPKKKRLGGGMAGMGGFGGEGGLMGGFGGRPDADKKATERKRAGQLGGERTKATVAPPVDPHQQKVIWAVPRSASSLRIQKALAAPLTSTGLDFAEAPLEEVVDFLRSEYEIEIQIDESALDDLGISTDEPVTVNLRNISLRSALKLMLRQLELTTIVADEVLMVTTEECCESRLHVAVFPVNDLAKEKSKLIELAKTLITVVASETWAKNGGGEAEIVPLAPGLLVISQTQAVHEEVADVLSAIRAARNAGK